MKPYFIELAKSEIYNTERMLKHTRKTKALVHRLERAKKMHDWLIERSIVKVKPKNRGLPPAKREIIKQHLLNGEKHTWISATCNVSVGTLTKMKKELKTLKERE